jgi:hypothetical protein
MPRTCTICEHPKIEQINKAVMRQHSFRSIAARYELSKSALHRHMKRHVTKALRQLSKTEMPIAQAAEIGEPVLVDPASAGACACASTGCPH